MSTKTVRTRFAPSPTGYLHVGGLRTALYSYLFAKKHKGEFILRIEDTDQARKVEGSTEALLDITVKMGLIYDQGPVLKKGVIVDKGEDGPYIQSQRLPLYRKFIDQLIADGKAYHSFKTPEELEILKAGLLKVNQPLKKHHLNENFTAEVVNTKITQGEKYVIRFETPKTGKVNYHDLVRGDIEFDCTTIDDFILLKSDGFPTYHLASIVDDSSMKITHVIRAEEWLSSTPKHLLLYEAFGLEKPEFAHLPLILNPDKTKLSKRQADVAVEDYLQKGYLPETLINFIALLGWNPGAGSTEEIFSMDDLIEKFELDHVNKSGAVFDIKKLNWMNAQYLRTKMTLEQFMNHPEVDKKFVEYLGDSKLGHTILNDELKKNLLATISRERIEFFGELDIFFAENAWLNLKPKYEAQLLAWKKSTLEDAKLKLTNLFDFLNSIADESFNAVSLETSIKQWIADNNFGMGDVLWPMRVALTGQEKSPNPFEAATLLGKEETLIRIKNAIEISK